MKIKDGHPLFSICCHFPEHDSDGGVQLIPRERDGMKYLELRVEGGDGSESQVRISPGTLSQLYTALDDFYA